MNANHYDTMDLLDAFDDARADGEGVGEKDIERQLDKRGLAVCSWIKVGECDPEDGQLMVCTDGECRWLNIWRTTSYGDPWTGGLNRKRATHWFPVLEIPKA